MFKLEWNAAKIRYGSRCHRTLLPLPFVSSLRLASGSRSRMRSKERSRKVPFSFGTRCTTSWLDTHQKIRDNRQLFRSHYKNSLEFATPNTPVNHIIIQQRTANASLIYPFSLQNCIYTIHVTCLESQSDLVSSSEPLRKTYYDRVSWLTWSQTEIIFSIKLLCGLRSVQLMTKFMYLLVDATTLFFH